ncbi:MAG: glycosyltransferase family 4 protein [Candidatus Shapirobacteria bacterium]
MGHDISTLYRKINLFLESLLDTGKNIIGSKNKIYYIVEPIDWTIKREGIAFKKNIPSIVTRSTTRGLNNKLVHFGSNPIYNPKTSLHNKTIISYYHVTPKDTQIDNLSQYFKNVDIIHTSCQITKDKLVKLGVPDSKIVVIPIPVDTNNFYPYTTKRRQQLKQKFQLPVNKFIIGSFQKDGNGWQEGNEPKLIKGPDILCDALIKISKIIPIHVLLTGPSRGYVKNRLQAANISYSHFYPKYEEIPNLFNVLDLYLVTSREEGGPKMVLESMACGIPLISTKVGQAPEIIKSGTDAFLVNQEDTDTIVNITNNLYYHPDIRQKISQNAVIKSQQYSLKKISKLYWDKLYYPLLK